MQSKTLFAIMAAGVAPAIADSTTLDFAYWSGSSSSIGGLTTDGQSISFASNGAEVYYMTYPDNATPCSSPGTKYAVTSTCFSGEADFTCYSNFDGTPSSCSGVSPQDGSTVDGSTDSGTTFAGITMSNQGNCVGTITLDNTCTSDDTFTLSATIL